MATSCGDSVLTGQEGSIMFKPPGTSYCLEDFVDFEGGQTHITVPCEHDFREDDIVCFYESDGGNIDSSLTASGGDRAARVVDGAILVVGIASGGNGYTASLPPTTAVAFADGSGTNATGVIGTNASGVIDYVAITDGGAGYEAGDILQLPTTAGAIGNPSDVAEISVTSVAHIPVGATGYFVVGIGPDWIEVSETQNGTPITLTGDGGTGSANQGTIEIELCDYYAVCGVRDFSIDISREELDVTTLPCADDGEGCQKLVTFRKTQAGYASATGTMSVYFTCDQENIANRLLGSSILKDQNGARVKLYVCTQFKDGEVDDTSSLFIDAFINITGMSFSVNPDDPTTAELSFSVRGMNSAFGIAA